jgi:trigger factor
VSSTETVETTPDPEATPTTELESSSPAGESHHDHEHHDHHHDHDHDHHEHTHGPTLNPECTREVDIELPAEEVTRSFQKVVKRYQKMARIPGFRAGKVPESLIRSRFADSIRQDVIEALLPAQFQAAIEQNSLKPISRPQVTDIQLQDGKPLHFKAAFEVLPEFSVDGYENVRVEKPDLALTDAEFDAELERVRESRATLEPVSEDRGLEKGDWAQITFRGEIQGEPAEGEPAAETKPIEGDDVQIEVGGEKTLDAFNSALVGAKPGQELKFEVSYPGEFEDRRLAGKTVAYDVEVKGIKKKILPELTDDFAKELGEYESIEDFRTKLRDYMSAEKSRRGVAETKERLVNSLVERYQFPIPESLVQQQIDVRLDRGLRALAAQGMRADDMRKLDFERLRVVQRESAVGEVKGSLILDRIAEQRGLEVTDEEVEQQLQLIALQSREPLDSVRTRLTEDGGLARIREQLRREKTAALLYEGLNS